MSRAGKCQKARPARFASSGRFEGGFSTRPRFVVFGAAIRGRVAAESLDQLSDQATGKAMWQEARAIFERLNLPLLVAEMEAV